MTQNELVMEFLRKGTALTARSASRVLEIDRLAARVYDLRRHGAAIESEMVSLTSGKQIAVYYLKGSKRASAALS